MNELKPEDVIKALEHCANYKRAEVSCIGCPLYGKCDVNTLESLALALLRELTEQNLALGEVILKKDARIEHLEKTMKESILSNTELLENLNKLVEEKNVEIERLNTAMDVMVLEHKRLIEIERRKNQ